ncbi:chloride channel protein [Enterobacteriaceae bacterium LUAb1]
MHPANKYSLNWSSILVAIPVGIVASLVTLGFRQAIAWIERMLFGSDLNITQAMAVYPWYSWPLITGAGGIIAGFFLNYATVMERNKTLKTDYLEVINDRLDSVPGKTSLFRALSSMASITSGASIGKEGPMVQLSALAGSVMGRFCFRAWGLKNSDIVAMAAAAGLSSVYHAPLASAIFVAEIALGIAALQRLIPLLIASGVAVLTMWALGFRSAMYPLIATQFALTPSTLLVSVVTGLVAGLTGWLMIWLTGRSKLLFGKVKSLPLRLGSGGVVVGFMAMISTAILGNGYEAIIDIMAGKVALSALLVLLSLKLLATAVSAGSHAVGGLFTPALLVGAALGVILADCAIWLGMPAGDVLLYAAIGMGAVLAAVSQAPLMAMLMVLEMTGNSSLLFPVMIASALAAMMAYRLHIAGAYSVVATHVSRSDAKFAFDNGVVMQCIVSAVTLLPEETAGKALAVSSLKRERFVYVTDASGAFLGAVSVHDISQKILDKTITLNSPVSQVMDSTFPCVYQNQTIREGWNVFAAVALERLPVLNNPQQRKYLGVLTKTRLMQKVKAFI